MTDDKSSWKSLEQLLTSPALTPISQKRRRWMVVKKVLIVGALVAVVGAVSWGLFYLQGHSRTLAPYAEKTTKTTIVFFSDGQLSRRWFDEHFPTLAQKGLLSIDIRAVQSALLKDSQVMAASVERHFPSTLKVTLRERQPMGRVKIKEAGKNRIYYVAGDGTFYTSNGYIAPANLPFITSANLISSDGKLLPLAGAATLADILDGLKRRYPNLAARMNYLDLKSWIFPVTGQTSVAIKLNGGVTLRFGGTNIPLQLDRLKEVLSLINDEKMPLKNKTIDLTYPDRVAIMGGDK